MYAPDKPKGRVFNSHEILRVILTSIDTVLPTTSPKPYEFYKI
jgi:hypothetical protein